MALAAGCAGAVLTGGASLRMGADKAFIEVDGEAMARRAAAALADAGVSVIVAVGGDVSRLRALGLRAVPDRHPGEGPLGAVITALHALDAVRSAADAVVTLPCDVVRPDAASVRAVLDSLEAECGRPGSARAPADVVVPVAGGVPQWLHAAWRRSCLGGLERAFAHGVRAPKQAVTGLQALKIDVAGIGWCRDADRPQELPDGARILPDWSR